MFKLSRLKYGEILSIKELKLPSNRTICIVGKSGGGKTTFLKMLNNMLTPDSGSLTFRGQEVSQYDPVQLRRKVVMLPQNPIVFPGSIKDNFRKTREYTEGEEPEREAMEELLVQVGLDQSLESGADRLSGGEKQRLALARVLLMQPEVLLLDEPSSSLDETTEQQIIEMVIQYTKKNNGTLIMVTHSRSIAEKYADLIITIENGRVTGIAEGGG